MGQVCLVAELPGRLWVFEGVAQMVDDFGHFFAELVSDPSERFISPGDLWPVMKKSRKDLAFGVPEISDGAGASEQMAHLHLRDLRTLAGLVPWSFKGRSKASLNRSLSGV